MLLRNRHTLLLNYTTQVRVIAVPSFAATGEVVLVDLDTLEAKPLKFGMSELDGWNVPGPAPMDTQQ
jgi:hypothetical protein